MIDSLKNEIVQIIKEPDLNITSYHGEVTDEVIIEFKNKADFNSICKFNKLSEDFMREF